jgi:hypothetical protein
MILGDKPLISEVVLSHYACKKYKFLLSKGPPIGSPLLFVRNATRVKSLSFTEKETVDRELLAFCMRCYACKKTKIFIE